MNRVVPENSSYHGQCLFNYKKKCVKSLYLLLVHRMEALVMPIIVEQATVCRSLTQDMDTPMNGCRSAHILQVIYSYPHKTSTVAISLTMTLKIYQISMRQENSVK